MEGRSDVGFARWDGKAMWIRCRSSTKKLLSLGPCDSNRRTANLCASAESRLCCLGWDSRKRLGQKGVPVRGAGMLNGDHWLASRHLWRDTLSTKNKKNGERPRKSWRQRRGGSKLTLGHATHFSHEQ